MSGIPKAISGDKYGYLTLIKPTEKRSRNGDVYWMCRCECGNIVHRRWDSIMQSIVKGCTISCGCKRSKDIGKRLAYDQKRIERARKALGQIDGTTIQGIDRKKINKNNKSGVRGVCFKSREQKWQAGIELRGKQVGRKLFKTKEEAIAWRRYLEQEYFEPLKEKYKEQQNDDT